MAASHISGRGQLEKPLCEKGVTRARAFPSGDLVETANKGARLLLTELPSCLSLLQPDLLVYCVEVILSGLLADKFH